MSIHSRARSVIRFAWPVYVLLAPVLLAAQESAPPLGEKEAAIEAALAQPTLLNFVDQPLSDVVEFLRQHQGESIVLTVFFPAPVQLADAKEAKRMEEESFMKIGRKKYKMTGHFPPTPDDPYLRLVFPRQLGPKDKTIEFDLYLPGAPDPYRIAEYAAKELMYKGKLEI